MLFEFHNLTILIQLQPFIMNKSIRFFTVFLLLFLVYSCGFGEKKPEKVNNSNFRTESALGLYEISIPKYMKTATDLNADASMQFQNIYKETYLAIIDEDKDDFVDAFKELNEYDASLSTAGNYRKIQMDYFLESMEVIKKSTPKPVEINGMSAEQVEFTGRVPGVDFDIFYVMTFVEGQDNLYMMMIWTLGKSEGKFKDTFYRMADSFNEL